jgi:twinkle protein
MESKFLTHIPCENCGSSDGNSLYDDGHQYCFVCESFISKTEGDKMPEEHTQKAPIQGVYTNILSKGILSSIPDRKLNVATCKSYGVTVEKTNEAVTKHIYPYYNSDRKHIGNKTRVVATKEFRSEGNISDGTLFGQNNFDPVGKYITVTEGELDAMSAYQMFGSKWPCVSVKSSSSALTDCKKNFKYLNSFNTIVLCFDNDTTGRNAANKVAAIFEPHKCKIVNLKSFKDASDYLKAGQREEFIQLWWNSTPYTPAGLVNLGTLGSSLYEENYCETVSYPWSGLNEKIYGIRTGELVTFTSGTGMGKSSVIRELMHHIMKNTKDNIGVFALEESIKNTAFNIMSVEANQRLYIKEIRDTFSLEQLKEWEDNTIGTNRFVAFDHFGSMSNEDILGLVRFMSNALDCKWIVLDHLSMVISGQQDGDERRNIDNLMSNLRKIVEECNVSLLVVSHLRRTSSDRGHEEGREVSLAHLRGSQSIGQLSDAVIALERNQQAQDPTEANTTTVRILKNRYTGETGIATYLFYDKETGRMSEISNPFEVEGDNDEVRS